MNFSSTPLGVLGSGNSCVQLKRRAGDSIIMHPVLGSFRYDLHRPRLETYIFGTPLATDSSHPMPIGLGPGFCSLDWVSWPPRSRPQSPLKRVRPVVSGLTIPPPPGLIAAMERTSVHRNRSGPSQRGGPHVRAWCAVCFQQTHAHSLQPAQGCGLFMGQRPPWSRQLNPAERATSRRRQFHSLKVGRMVVVVVVGRACVCSVAVVVI